MQTFSSLFLCFSFGASALAFSLEEATSVFNQSQLDKAAPGVYSKGGYLFVVSETKDDEASIEWGPYDQLEIWLAGSPKQVKSPFPEKLTKNLLPKTEFKIPSATSCLVYERTANGQCRRVTAFDLPALLAEKERVSKQAESLTPHVSAQWGALLRGEVAKLSTSEHFEYLHGRIGFPMGILANGSGAKVFSATTDDVEMVSAFSQWSSSAKVSADCDAVLSVMPSFPEALRRKGEIALEAGNPISALSYYLAAGVDGATNEVVEAIVKAAGEKYGSDVFEEFGKLLRDLEAVEGSVLTREDRLWTYFLRTCGNLQPPATKRSDEGRFDKAQKLYAMGQDVPTILRLLQESIEIDASDAEKWRYLGGALRVSGNLKDSLRAYHQAFRMAPKSTAIVLDLAKTYQGAGYPKLAAGAAWFVLAYSADAFERSKAEELLGTCLPFSE